MTREQIEGMAAKLAAKLERDPDNAEGWAMLARTYYALNRYNDAVPAFEKATALIPNDAGLLADYADAVGAAEGGLHGKAQALIVRALAADPTHWKALALAGTAAFERKDYKQAAPTGRRPRRRSRPTSPLASSIDASIAEARQLGGLAAGATAPTPPTAAAPAVPAATTARRRAAGDDDAATRATGPANAIAGTVSLAPALVAKAAPTDTVFIFARAARGAEDAARDPAQAGQGSAGCVHARRLDGHGAEFRALEISVESSSARACRNPETPMPQSGDLEGFSPAVKVGATGLAVVIDRAP